MQRTKRFSTGITIEKSTTERSTTLLLQHDPTNTKNLIVQVPNLAADLTIQWPNQGTKILSDTNTATVTNKSIDGTQNTITNIPGSSIAGPIPLTTLAPVTANRALESNGSGVISPSTVTSTELSYVSGVTSALQAQIDAKASIASLTAHTSASAGVHGVTGDVVGTSDVQSLTNKDIDTSTASNTNRITIGKNTLTNLSALTRKEATLVYGTDTKQLYVDDGSTLLTVGGSWTSYASESITASGTITISLTTGLQYRRIEGSGGSVTTSLTPFGTTAPPDGTVVRLVGQSNTNSVVVNNYDAAKGTILNGIAEIGYGDVLELQYDSVLDRWIETFRNF